MHHIGLLTALAVVGALWLIIARWLAVSSRADDTTPHRARSRTARPMDNRPPGGFPAAFGPINTGDREHRVSNP